MSKISQEELIEIINEKWTGSKKCPICEQNQWAVSNQLLELRSFPQGRVSVFKLGQMLMPLIPVACRNCGYTHFFNAIELDIYKLGELIPAKDLEGDKNE